MIHFLVGQPFLLAPTQKRRVSLHVVYTQDLDTLAGEIRADREGLRIPLGTRFVRDRFEKGLPAVTDE